MSHRAPQLAATRLIALGLALCQLAVVGYAIPCTFGPSAAAGIAAATLRLGIPAGVVLVAVGVRRITRDDAGR